MSSLLTRLCMSPALSIFSPSFFRLLNVLIHHPTKQIRPCWSLHQTFRCTRSLKDDDDNGLILLFSVSDQGFISSQARYKADWCCVILHCLITAEVAWLISGAQMVKFRSCSCSAAITRSNSFWHSWHTKPSLRVMSWNDQLWAFQKYRYFIYNKKY